MFQAGKQIMGEKVMSGGVPLDECEPDKICGDEAEGRKEVRLGGGQEGLLLVGQTFRLSNRGSGKEHCREGSSLISVSRTEF